jgi:prevent-host-death family protein
MAMKRVRIAELKDHLSEYLRAAEHGQEVVVTDRNRPIARISPMPGTGRQVHLVPPSRDFVPIRDRARVEAGWVIDSTRLLREERAER